MVPVCRSQQGRRQAIWAVSGEISTARQCRKYGACTSRTADADTDTTDSMLRQHPFALLRNYLVWKNKIHRTILHAAVEVARVSLRGFHAIMPSTRGLPQSNELRVQPDRRRQAVWAVLRAKSTARPSGVPCPSRTTQKKKGDAL